MIIGIDPGTDVSGVVLWDDVARKVVLAHPDLANAEVRAFLVEKWAGHRIAVEWIQAMGMPVGQEVFLTCRAVGRLEEIAAQRGQAIEYITRPTVKTRLCGHPRAKDPNVRAALIDRLGPVGTKKQPGPLYGVSSHAWSALAVAIAIDLQ